MRVRACTDGQTDRQKDRQTDEQADRRIDRQAETNRMHKHILTLLKSVKKGNSSKMPKTFMLD